MKRKKTWRELHTDRLRSRYGLYARMWENESDDRKHFCNTYVQIAEALESLPPSPPAWICVAVQERLAEEEKRMDGVIRRYKAGLWGEPVVPTLEQKLEIWPDLLRSTVEV